MSGPIRRPVGPRRSAGTQPGRLPAHRPPNVQEYRFSSGNTGTGGKGMQQPILRLESGKSPGNKGFLAGSPGCPIRRRSQVRILMHPLDVKPAESWS